MPAHVPDGVTLAMILDYLVERIGWQGMASRVTINCFKIDPSIESSLTFLRRTPWARTKVEELYLELKESEAKRA